MTSIITDSTAAAVTTGAQGHAAAAGGALFVAFLLLLAAHEAARLLDSERAADVSRVVRVLMLPLMLAFGFNGIALFLDITGLVQ